MSLSPSEEKKDIVLHDEYAQDIPKVDAVLGLSHLTPAEAARTVDRIKAVRNAAFAAAIAKSPIDWKSRSSMLLYWTLFICLCVKRHYHLLILTDSSGQPRRLHKRLRWLSVLGCFCEHRLRAMHEIVTDFCGDLVFSRLQPM